MENKSVYPVLYNLDTIYLSNNFPLLKNSELLLIT